MSSLALVTAATEYPVSIAEAKAHMRVDNTDEDGYIEGLIAAATNWCQASMQRQFVNATWRLSLNYWPLSYIQVPLPPLVSVTSIVYVDTAGTSQTWGASNYTVNTDQQPGTITPAWSVVWPDIRTVPQAIKVTYVAGYGSTAASVPACVKQAILLMVANWFEQREPVLTGTISKEIEFSVASLLSAEGFGAYA